MTRGPSRRSASRGTAWTRGATSRSPDAARGKRLHVSVEAIGAVDDEALKVEADALAALRGAEPAVVTVAAGASAP